MALPLTTKNFLLTFKEFLTVWLNQILYYNHIYDPLVFDKVTAFDLVVYKNRHPNLDQYIDQLFVGIINELIIHREQAKTPEAFNGLYNINCLIYNVQTNTVVSRHTINFHQFIVNLQETVFDLSLSSVDTSSKINIEHISWNEMNTQYSTALFHHTQHLKKLDPQKTDPDAYFFKVTVDVDKLLYINNRGGNWVRLNRGDDNPSHSDFTAIGQVDLDILNFSCYTETYR
ncbi:hypothetical protein Cantr_01608 [Candida viswanathii]|uniref:HORMA domain-containing protein n=1 Tax=Candida viswanathii TaxID=5486 RepID=A0A367YIV1_9ASCO|nr:hypothetical protein Cantr_01608 [Candida viswanathii]